MNNAYINHLVSGTRVVNPFNIFFFLWLKISHHVKREIFCVVSSSVAIQMHQSFEHPFLCASLCFERGWMKTNNRICSAVKHPPPPSVPKPGSSQEVRRFLDMKVFTKQSALFTLQHFKKYSLYAFYPSLSSPSLFTYSFILSCSLFIIVACM